MEIGVSFGLSLLCNAICCWLLIKKMLLTIEWISLLAWVSHKQSVPIWSNPILIIQCDLVLFHFLAKFDVKNDMIIKTAESRNLGGKFLDNADSLTKVECLHLCCETESCDVFVFEEKVCIELPLCIVYFDYRKISIRMHSICVIISYLLLSIGSRWMLPIPLWTTTRFSM